METKSDEEYPVITLESWEYEWASHVGTRRYIENWGEEDATYYDRDSMQDDRTAEVAAAVAELAVAKYTNRFWSGHVWCKCKHKQYRDIPDVGTNIEVRRIRYKNSSAAVRKHQVGRGLVLFVARPIEPELREVIIYGYIPYDRAWDLGTPYKRHPETTRLISSEHLTLRI